MVQKCDPLNKSFFFFGFILIMLGNNKLNERIYNMLRPDLWSVN